MSENVGIFSPADPSGSVEIRAREVDCWRLEPHVCRQCFARVVSQKAAEGGRRYLCTNCGLEGVSRKPSTICACGIKLRRRRSEGGTAQSLTDAGVRCHENRHRTLEFPSVITASYGGVQAEDE